MAVREERITRERIGFFRGMGIIFRMVLVSLKSIYPKSLPRRSWVLIRHQLQDLLRRPMSFWILWAFLFFTCFGFIATYYDLSTSKFYVDDAKEKDQVSREILHSYRQFSFFTLFLIVPIIGVYSISRERDSGTLDLIMTSAVEPIEFVLSKAAASFSVVLVALLSALPILGVTFFMGGVSPWDIYALIIIQLLLALCSLCIGITMGALIPTFFLGLALSYLIISVMFWPAYLASQFGTPNEQPFAALVWLFLSVVFAIALLYNVPDFLAREINRVRPKSWRPIRLKGVDTQLWSFLGTRDYGEPIHEKSNPVYVSERERFLSFVTRRDYDAPSVLWLISIPFTGFLFNLPQMLTVLYILILLFVPMVGASVVAGEYERKSWESLRSSMLKTRTILWGKLRLTFGQGMIHIVAFYVPPVIILGMIWYLVSNEHQSGIGYFEEWNVYPVWMGNLLSFITIIPTIFLISCFSVWISTYFKRTFPALMTSYGWSAFFLFAPLIVMLMTGIEITVGDNPNPLMVIFMIWNAPLLFNLWPQSASLFKNMEAGYDLFWDFYLGHLLFLLLLSFICLQMAYYRIKRADV